MPDRLDELTEELADLLEAPSANDQARGRELLDMPSGLYPDIPPEVYHARIIGFASKGALDNIIDHPPAYYRAWVDGLTDPDEEPEPLTFGRAFHCAALEPDRFAMEYAIEPAYGDLRLKGPKDARKAWRSEHPAREYLDAATGKRVLGMCESLWRHPKIAPLLKRGAREVTARWQHQPSGIECKARPDWLNLEWGAALDLKSCKDARLSAFELSSARYNYHRQRRWYADEGLAAVGVKIGTYPFVCVEKSPPYLVAVYYLDHEATQLAADEIAIGLDTLARCCATDEWPGFPVEFQRASLPRWRLMKGV